LPINHGRPEPETSRENTKKQIVIRTLTLYSDILLDHYRNPRNVGTIEGADAVGVAENAACGDLLELYLSVQGDRVNRATFKSFGCAAALAAGSVLTELLKGLALDQVQGVRREAVAMALGGLPPMKMHCAVLAEQAAQSAWRDYQTRSGV
jgi:nitrogen fixation NifU-like protein